MNPIDCIQVWLHSVVDILDKLIAAILDFIFEHDKTDKLDKAYPKPYVKR